MAHLKTSQLLHPPLFDSFSMANSVTRGRNKKSRKIARCCPKSDKNSFYLKSYIFQKNPKCVQIFGQLLHEDLSTIIFKNRLIWSHWWQIGTYCRIDWICKISKMCLFFFIFIFSIMLRINNVQWKLRRWRDSNSGPLVSEATALSTEP